MAPISPVSLPSTGLSYMRGRVRLTRGLACHSPTRAQCPYEPLCP
jgi:hypothetical protein